MFNGPVLWRSCAEGLRPRQLGRLGPLQQRRAADARASHPSGRYERRSGVHGRAAGNCGVQPFKDRLRGVRLGLVDALRQDLHRRADGATPPGAPMAAEWRRTLPTHALDDRGCSVQHCHPMLRQCELHDGRLVFLVGLFANLRHWAHDAKPHCSDEEGWRGLWLRRCNHRSTSMSEPNAL